MKTASWNDTKALRTLADADLRPPESEASEELQCDACGCWIEGKAHYERYDTGRLTPICEDCWEENA